jgi:hypothetical protein
MRSRRGTRCIADSQDQATPFDVQTDLKTRKQVSVREEATPVMTQNKFSNSYGFNFNQGITSPRATNTTHFGHVNIGIEEEEQIDIEYSIEEKIDESCAKLERMQVKTHIPDRPAEEELSIHRSSSSSSPQKSTNEDGELNVLNTVETPTIELSESRFFSQLKSNRLQRNERITFSPPLKMTPTKEPEQTEGLDPVRSESPEI